MKKNEHSNLLPLAQWSNLSDEDLQEELVRYIMNGNTAHYIFTDQYLQQIAQSGIRDRVDKTLLNLIGRIDDGVGERAIRICVDLKLKSVKEKILMALPKVESTYNEMKATSGFEKFGIRTQYLYEFNNAAMQFDLKEALSFIVRQLEPLKSPTPVPAPTKEYHFYLVAESARAALYKIAPDLAKDYKK